MITEFYYIYNQEDILIQEKENTVTVPSNECMALDMESKFLFHQEGDHKHYLIEFDKGMEVPENFRFKNMRDMRDFYRQNVYNMASRSYQLYNWRNKHRFCGTCGSLFDEMKADRSLSCSNCGNLIFPQTSNAVITAIFKDDKILLAHNKNFPEGLYSLIAGFVEMGESFEEAVCREIYEEVGIQVKNVSYYGSQEWPFPNSTMIGFFADYESGQIKVDGEEIVDAGWYTPEEFPTLPGGASIARKLIEVYRDRYFKE